MHVFAHAGCVTPDLVSDDCCHFYRVYIRRNHEYKLIWSDSMLEKELECKREPGNPSDTHNPKP